jgi:hypothetical protein
MSAVHKADDWRRLVSRTPLSLAASPPLLDSGAEPELVGDEPALFARLLEERPELSPFDARRILISTADRVQGRAPSRKRFGIVNPARALDLARRRDPVAPTDGIPPFLSRNRLVFTYHDAAAAMVELHGDFRGWRTIVASFTRTAEALWQASIEIPLPGRYRYKFLVDGESWTEDPSHGLTEPDGFGGFNSIVHVGWDTR